jgi:hypothetical protein
VTSDPQSGEQPEASRSVEVELKFDVDDGTPLPDWSRLPGVASVGAPELRELDARYFDTADLALARAGYALRRRSGGPDAGWHLKGPRVGDGRVELQWPLGDSDELPPAVEEAVSAVILDAATGEARGPDASSLARIARILNTRTAYALRDADGGVVAEFVDDRVRATDERSGAERGWREWELELGPAGPIDPAAFFAAAESAVHAAGGRAAASASKLARALGA